MEQLACQQCGARVAGPATLCPLCRGALLPAPAENWVGTLSADGRWKWDGQAWSPVEQPAVGARIVSQGEFSYKLGGLNPGSMPADFATRIAQQMGAEMGRLLQVHCPGCGAQDFEAHEIGAGPIQVTCRRCGRQFQA